jgi:hypothetical protein
VIKQLSVQTTVTKPLIFVHTTPVSRLSFAAIMAAVYPYQNDAIGSINAVIIVMKPTVSIHNAILKQSFSVATLNASPFKVDATV